MKEILHGTQKQNTTCGRFQISKYFHTFYAVILSEKIIYKYMPAIFGWSVRVVPMSDQ
jgi:hypothetical protein